MSPEVPRNRVQAALIELEDRIEELEGQIRQVAPLVVERDRLLQARAVILGEPMPMPIASGRSRRAAPRLSREDVLEYLVAHPGASAGEIASELQADRGAVSAHLQRGKGKRFSLRAGRWYAAPG